MRQTKTLNVHFILITFSILLATGFISGVILLVLNHFKWTRYFEHSPWLALSMIIIASIIIGTLISLLVSKQLLRPLNDLVAATKEVSQGNFSVSVPPVNKNMELDSLVRNFNQMVAELNHVEMMHDDFITNFSHEFKTPITSIQGFAKQLQGNDLTEAERAEFMAIIVSESGRLAHLSSNILQLSNLENHGTIRLNKQPYSLSEQLRHCLVILQNDWEAKELDLALELEEVQFVGDEEMMMSLWLNLLHNGIKFSPPGSTLSLSCYTLGRQIKVRLSDEGIGMSDDVRQKIFGKFYQGDTTRQGKGSGLGLTIAKQITELHEGRISVKSVAGAGTSVTVIFER